MSTRSFDLSKMKPVEVFKLMLGFIVPRPIGWISTISAEGIPNLAPFSFFNMVSNNPPILLFSPAISREGRRKDSLLNVQETKCFVHNVVTRELAERMNKTSSDYSRGVNEFEKAGLTPISSQFVPVPRVKEALINVECKLKQIISLGDKPGNGQLVFGEAVAIHVNDESVLDEEGMIRSKALKVIARLGKHDYLDFGEVFTMPLPILEGTPNNGN